MNSVVEPIEKTNQIVEYSQTEAALGELQTELAGVIFDCTIPAELDAAKKARAKVRGLRTSLEALRVQVKAPYLEHSKLIDSEAHRITDALRELETPIDDQIKIEERVKVKRKAAKDEQARLQKIVIQDSIDAIRARPLDFINKGTEEIDAAILSAQKAEIALPETYETEFLPLAQLAMQDAIRQLHELRAAAAERAEAAIRLEKERKELAEERRLETEAREKRESEAREKAKKEEQERQERLRKETKERQEREADEAEKRRKEEMSRTERLEKERLEREAREKKETEAREAREKEAAEKREAEELRLKEIREETARKQRDLKEREAKEKAEKLADQIANTDLAEAIDLCLAYFEENDLKELAEYKILRAAYERLPISESPDPE